jgi:hypothetical protein
LETCGAKANQEIARLQQLMTDTQEEHLVDALCVQLCSVVRSEGRYGSARPYPPKRGIPPNAIAVSVLNEGYSKAFHNTVLPDVVRGLGLAKTSVLLRDKRMAGCVSVQTDESNNQLMVWPVTRGPCACARDIPKRIASHSDATWAELRRAEHLGRAARHADRNEARLANQSGWRTGLPPPACSPVSLTRKTPPRSPCPPCLPSASPVTVTCDVDEMAGCPRPVCRCESNPASRP